MATLSYNTKWQVTPNATKKITLNTSGTYLDRDIEIASAASGTAEATFDNNGIPVAGTNITYSSTNNGIKVNARRVATSGLADSEDAATATDATYVSKVVLETGTAERQIIINTPNGVSNPTDFTVKVDTSGNVWIE